MLEEFSTGWILPREGTRSGDNFIRGWGGEFAEIPTRNSFYMSLLFLWRLNFTFGDVQGELSGGNFQWDCNFTGNFLWGDGFSE